MTVRRVAALVVATVFARATAASAQDTAAVRVASDQAARPDAPNVRMLATGALSAATWTQLLGMPEKWPRTWRGYGYRVGDQAGFIVADELLRYGLEKAVPWHRAPCASRDARGRWARVRAATACGVSSTFVAQNAAGERRPNVPVLGAIIGATALSLAWRPERGDAHKAQLFLLTRAGIVAGATVVNRGVRGQQGH